MKLRPCLDSEIALFLIKMIYDINPCEIITSLLDNHIECLTPTPTFNRTYRSFVHSQHTYHSSCSFRKVWLQAGRLPAVCLGLPAVLRLRWIPPEKDCTFPVNTYMCSARRNFWQSSKAGSLRSKERAKILRKLVRPSRSDHKKSISPRNLDQSLLQPIKTPTTAAWEEKATQSF